MEEKLRICREIMAGGGTGGSLYIRLGEIDKTALHSYSKLRMKFFLHMS